MIVSRDDLLQLTTTEYNYIIENADMETVDLVWLLLSNMLAGECEVPDELMPVRFLIPQDPAYYDR